MKIKWKTLTACLLIPVAAGALSAFLTRNGMQAFEQARQPVLTPPQWLFPIVWTVLYLMMGTASYLVAVSKKPLQLRRQALTVYAFQLAVNVIWPLIFFNLRQYLLAFIWLIFLWLLVWLTFTAFSRVNKTAGKLLVPYLLWLLFAAYLNFSVYLLN